MGYSDHLRAELNIPVFDAITCCDFFINGFKDNNRFGIADRQQTCDDQQEAYKQGQELEVDATKKLQSSPTARKSLSSEVTGAACEVASLGIIRLDYDYETAPGDIDDPRSFDFKVHYRCVPGLTFEVCQSGKIDEKVEEEFFKAIEDLEKRKVCGISGDCGFMMWLQPKARQHIKSSVPVFMSSLAQLPSVTRAYHESEKIAILTANGKTLEPMRELIKEECGVDTENERYVIVGCEKVPGFEAVAL